MASTERQNRKSNRLREYDYQQPGWYYVTICTYRGTCLFGEIDSGCVIHSPFGAVAVDSWLAIPEHFGTAEIDHFVVMPNHIHGILGFGGPSMGQGHVGATHASPLRPKGPLSGSLGAVTGSFQSACSRIVNRMRGTPGAPVWQRNYYDHIVRDDQDLNRIRQYIRDNPLRWDLDDEHPSRRGVDE